MVEIRRDFDRRVLIVEDDASLRVTYRHALERTGWRCALAANIRTAKLLLGGQQYDAALLDLGLPDGNGLQLIGCVVARNPGARVVVATGAGGTETGSQATRQGAHVVLDKPIGVEELRRAMEGADAAPIDLASIHTIDWIVYQHIKRIHEQLGCNVSHTANAIGRSRNWVKKTLARGAPPR